MLETTERIGTKCQVLDADCWQTQGAKYDNKFQWSEENKTNPTSFWAEKDFFAIIPTRPLHSLISILISALASSFFL